MMAWTTALAVDKLGSHRVIKSNTKMFQKLFPMNTYLFYCQVSCHLLVFIPRGWRHAPKVQELFLWENLKMRNDHFLFPAITYRRACYLPRICYFTCIPITLSPQNKPVPQALFSISHIRNIKFREVKQIYPVIWRVNARTRMLIQVCWILTQSDFHSTAMWDRKTKSLFYLNLIIMVQIFKHRVRERLELMFFIYR